MASRSLRRYDVQARVSLIVSILAGLGLLVLLRLLLRNYDSDLGAVKFGKESLFSPLYFLATAATMLLSTVGLVLGFNSAGQRRNNMPRRSWAAFFLGAVSLAGSIICVAMFWLLQLKV